jgi:site-specific DNA recombinase
MVRVMGTSASASTKPTCAAIYRRISSDPLDTRLAIARQLEDCQALAVSKGWTVAPGHIFTDNDVSAYSGKVRPAYRRMLEAAKASEFQVIVAADSDRLYRRMIDLVELVQIVKGSGVKIAFANAGEVDLETAGGIFKAEIMGSVAQHESAHKAERQRRKYQQLRETGYLMKSPVRAFGYEIGGMIIREDEATVIRAVADRVLAGEPIARIVKDLNRSGTTTATGGIWYPGRLTEVVLNPRYSGRVGQRAGVGDSPSIVTRSGRKRQGGWAESEARIISTGNWPAILTVEVQDALRSAMTGGKVKRGRTAEYLLTGGIAVCGRCNHNLSAAKYGPRMIRRKLRVDNVAGRVDFKCRIDETGISDKRCGNLTAAMAPVEAIVTEAVLAAVETGALNAVIADPDPEAVALMGEVETELALLSNDYGSGLIDRNEWLARQAPLKVRQRDLSRRLQSTLTALGLSGIPDPLRPAWMAGQLTLAQKRTVIKALIEAVVIKPADVKGSNVFNPDRIQINWRG